MSPPRASRVIRKSCSFRRRTMVSNEDVVIKDTFAEYRKAMAAR
jgi:hypothetical protein